jgi:hypothetical protein
MSTQKNNLSQYKEVNCKIRTVAADFRDLEIKLKEIRTKKWELIHSLSCLIEERKEIKESQELIKKSKQWNQ